MRSGRVLQGKIARLGDQYIVTFSKGGEIRIPTRTVDCYCRDLNEAYRYKRAEIQPGLVREHLDLAQWCITQRMYTQAEEQIRQAASIEPKSSQVRRMSDHLCAVQTRERDASPNSDAKENEHVSDNELERMITELPADAIEQFTTTIQPILVNRCGAAGCHGTNTSSAFRLNRTSSGRVLARSITARNLYATMLLVNNEDPANSPLITSPAAPHGTARESIFGQYDRPQYESLIEWVRISTKRNETETPKTIPRTDSSLLQARAIERPRFSRSNPSLPTITDPKHYEQKHSANHTQAQRYDNSNEASRRLESRDSFVPVDPFDPAVFNRRFLGLAKRSDSSNSDARPVARQAQTPSSENSPRSSASRK